MIEIKRIIFVGVILVLFLAGCAEEEIQENLECTEDADCVPATCCHPKGCVNIENKPDCSGIMCTMECAPGTMDCGQGRCVCSTNKCVAEIG